MEAVLTMPRIMKESKENSDQGSSDYAQNNKDDCFEIQ